MTTFAERLGRTLVIAPHADDEVLGCGGLIARLGDLGNPAHVAIVTEGMPPAYSEETVSALKQEASRAAKVLGAHEPIWLGFPAAGLDTVAHRSLNAALSQLMSEVKPNTLLLPFPGDIHRDHQIVFQSALVTARPLGDFYPNRILCYETVSETNWNAPHLTPAYIPTVHVDITASLDRKLEAFRTYASQMRQFPHERSVETLTALARFRGSTVHREAAEAFILVREVG